MCVGGGGSLCNFCCCFGGLITDMKQNKTLSDGQLLSLCRAGSPGGGDRDDERNVPSLTLGYRDRQMSGFHHMFTSVLFTTHTHTRARARAHARTPWI